MTKVERIRLSGSSALGDAIDAAAGDVGRIKTLLVFDFDRTLTNGISMPGESDISKLVRGGERTLSALRRASEAGAQMYIITARRPVRMTILQLFASLDHAQSVLSPFFKRGEVEAFRWGVDDLPLARGGNIYAAGYQKALALAHIISETEYGEECCRVLFFDDALVNAHVVAQSTLLHLSQSPKGGTGSSTLVDSLSVHWWDCVEEETGANPSMKASATMNADANYAESNRNMLKKFGVSEDECNSRIELYAAILRKTKSAREEAATYHLNEEAKRIIKASQSSREKMVGLESALQARFARGPRLPSSSRFDSLIVALDRMKATTDGAKPAKGEISWRERAAADKARAEAARSIFSECSVASYPSGKVSESALHWKTAFQIDIPSAGTTGETIFMATLSGGAYALKCGSASSIAEQWFGTEFMRKLGVPVPEIRLVLPEDEEHGEILSAIRNVAEEYSKRGDGEGSTKLMVRAYYGFQGAMYSPLMVMELVTGALPMGSLDRERAKALLDLEHGDARAAARLEAIGRCWLGDAILGFRDRFCSRLTFSVAHQDNGKAYEKAVKSAQGEDARLLLVGNCDNVLFAADDSAIDSRVATFGFAAIDNHIKHVSSGDEGTKRKRDLFVNEIVSALMPGSSSRDDPFEWLRFTVDVISHGYVLNDEALSTARMGASRALALLPSALTWAHSVLESADASTEWGAAISRINGDALDEIGRKLITRTTGILASLPETEQGGNVAARTYSASFYTAKEASLIGAHPPLWDALSPNLRKTLLDERVNGKALGDHAAGDLFRD